MMKRISLKMNRTLALVIAGMLAIGPVMAEKPSWANDGKGDKKENKDKRDKKQDERLNDDRSARDRERSSVRSNEYFQDRHRELIRDYYQEQYRSGRCPPGLAKKHNGCMPPGQAKKWSIGHRLPREVIFYNVPDALIVQIGRPPAGYRFVRVASDILLIAIGTGMVIDAIEDLGRM